MKYSAYEASRVAGGAMSAAVTAPAHLAACRNAGLFDRHDWSSLKLAIVSGSLAPPALIRELAAKLPGCAVTQLWGMTETQGALYSRPGDTLDIAAESAGRPSPGTEVRIVDPDGHPCPPGEEGELQLRGCLLFPGFFNNPAANEAGFTADGWYRTGDLATADAAGNVAITGRSKDVINRGGVKFNPRDVEDLLSDFRSAGGGKVRIVYLDPDKDSTAKTEVNQLGIPAVQFNVMGRQEMQVKQGYMGIAVMYANAHELISGHSATHRSGTAARGLK